MSLKPSETLSDLFSELSKTFSDRPAIGCDGRTLSYAELEVTSRRLAAWFRYELGLNAGDRIMVQIPNHLTYPIVLLGALRAGLVVVNLVNTLSLTRIERIVRETEARAFIYFEENEQARIFLEYSGIELHFVEARRDDLDHWWRRGIFQVLRRWMPRGRRRSHYWLSDLLSIEAMPGYSAPQIEPERLALIQYTSGTTGRSKGVMLSHRNVLENIDQVKEALTLIGLEGAQRLLLPLPLYHSYPLLLTLIQWVDGGYVELMDDARDTDRIAELFERVKPTVFAGISPIFIALTQNALFSQLDLSSLKCTLSGAAPLSDSLAERWALITGCPITQAYGVTEASPVITVDTTGQPRSGCVGTPLRDTSVRIVDQLGDRIPAGGVGEIQVKGPQISTGYWRDAAETDANITPDGWLRTGDIGRISTEGELFFVERSAEVIQIGGFRVFPSDVEAIVNAHPDVIDCAVVGVPGTQGEIQLKLFVVSNNRRLTHKQVRDYCRERLTRYKVPALVEFREQLPHSPVGKVLRKQLLEESTLG